MKENRSHYFFIPFLWEGNLTKKLRKQNKLEDWIKYRYNLMLNTSLKSLSNQTNPSPILILVGSNFLKTVTDIIKDRPLPSRAYLLEKRPGEIIHREFINENIKSRFIYLTRLDSDDLYHKDVANEIKTTSHHNNIRTLLYQIGYIYQWGLGKSCPYINPKPPFYTDIFTKHELLSNRYPKRKGHKSSIGKTQILSPGKFVVVCHSKNASSTFDSLKAASRRCFYSSEFRNNLYCPLLDMKDFGINRKAYGSISCSSSRKINQRNKPRRGVGYSSVIALGNCTPSYKHKPKKPSRINTFAKKPKQTIRKIAKKSKPKRIDL